MAEPVFEIYDLESDPAESDNVAARQPALQAEFRKILREAHTPSRHFPLFLDP